jgi:cytochrome P450
MDAQQITSQMSPAQAALWESFTGSTWDMTQVWSMLREQEPVAFIPALNMWAISRHSDVVVLLRDYERFGHLPAEVMGPVPDDLVSRLPDGYPLHQAALNNTDPPVHSRVRKLAQKPLTPKAVDRYEPMMREVANALVDGFVTEGRADIVERFALPYPVTILANILGFPDADHDRFKDWVLSTFQLFVPTLTPQRRHELAREQVELNDYVRAAIEQRRSDPGEDIISGLIRAAEGEGERSLSELEILGIVAQLIAGGFETTQGTISLALAALCEHPDAFDRVRADPGLLPSVVEETIRRYNPARGVFRVAKCDVEFHGQRIPKGDIIFVLVGAANQDPAAYSCPREFDIDRDLATLEPVIFSV